MSSQIITAVVVTTFSLHYDVCLFVANMYVCMYVCIHAYIHTSVCMYACMYVLFLILLGFFLVG